MFSTVINKKQSKRFDIADRDSLSVRVSEFGTITFQYRYRYHDKPSRIALGRYPDISLKQAREKIPELRQLYKFINETFSGNKQTDYDIYYWGDLVRLYELENRLPLISRELIGLERYRGIRRLRRKVS